MQRLPEQVNAFRLLVADTLRQAWSSGLTPFSLAVVGVCALFCLSAGIAGEQGVLPSSSWEPQQWLPRSETAKGDGRERGKHSPVTPEQARAEGVDVPTGQLTLGFGLFRIDQPRERGDSVRFVQLCVAGLVADTAGVLLLLVWTAGLVPQFFEPQSAAVLLAKPVPRGVALAGKYFGVVCYVALLAAALIGATWLALGVSTGVWEPRYLGAAPVLIVHFGTFYAASCLIAAVTRSTTATALLAVLAWFACGWASSVLAGGWAAAVPSPLGYTAMLVAQLNAHTSVSGTVPANAAGLLVASAGLAVVSLVAGAVAVARRDY